MKKPSRQAKKVRFLRWLVSLAVLLQWCVATEKSLEASLQIANHLPQRLTPELPHDKSIDEYRISPDGKTVVFSVVEIERLSPTSARLSNPYLFSTPIDKGPSEVNSIGAVTFESFLITSDSRQVVYPAWDSAAKRVSLGRSSIDGADPTLLAPLQGAWSITLTPDDKRIVYKETHVGDVLSIPLEGGTITQLNLPQGTNEFIHSFYHATLASRVLFFAGNYNGHGGTLYSVQPDGTDLISLSAQHSGANIPVRVNSISTSSFSEYVFFQDVDGPDDINSLDDDLYSVRADGGIPQKLVPPPGVSAYINPRFTPDGKTVVLDGYRSGGPANFYALPIEGGEPILVNAPLAAGQELDLSPQFSSDGQTIFYSVRGQSAGLFRASLDGSSVQQLNLPSSSGGGGIGYLWFVLSPDESTIAYMEDSDGDNVNDLFLVDSSGGVPVRLERPTVAGNVDNVNFSTDGRWMMYQVSSIVDGITISQPYLTRVDLHAVGFGLDKFDTFAIGVDATKTTYATFVDNKTILIDVGDVIQGRDLYVLSIPEPRSVLLVIIGCWIFPTLRLHKDPSVLQVK
jgi:Tol biopolymer transport system component